ncbi:MAG TPA: hypothetical protein VKZ43_07535, partial [Trueperaceae bacterium]|nr:hypothetical protein [Trueperaceae bacterium]
EDAPAQSVDLVGADDADPRTPTLVDEDAVAPASDDLDELLVAGDDFDADETAGEVDTYATSSHDSRFGGVPTGYLSDDDDSDSQPGALGVSTSDEGFTDVKFTEEEQVAPAPTTSGADWGDEISFGADGGAAHEQGAAVPDLWGPEATAQTDDSDLWTGPSGTSIDAFTDTRSGDTGMEEEAAWPADSVGAFTDSLEADTAATGAYSEQADPIQVAGTAFDESTDVGLAAVGATLLSAGTATLPLARPGTILRRNIDVSALAAAQLAVGQELGFDEPIGASAFLLRAVVKAATSTGYSTGAVGLAVLEEGVSIRRVDGAAEMPFTTLVGLIGSVDVEEDEPVLVAADLSGLDVDEAVLELETPVISLGRILYDNQRGAYRSTLSLTGPMPLDTAASLLARVAELLDAPVRLVL